MHPTISVIVPVYKTELYLPRCLDSLLAQTYRNLEIILVDDGSPDESGAICDEYAARDKRITVIHQPNSGVSAARNAGMAVAHGKYLAFCDSDDTVPPGAYASLAAKAEQTGADLVEGCYRSISPENYIKSIRFSRKSPGFFVYLSPTVWNKLYLRSMIEKNGLGFPTADYAEDCLFLVGIYPYVKRTARVKNIVYEYRIRDVAVSKSLTQTVSLRHFADWLQVSRTIIEQYEKLGLSFRVADEYLSTTRIWINYLYLMPESIEREQAFTLLKEHLSGFFRAYDPRRTLMYLGMPCDDFMQCTAKAYYGRRHFDIPEEYMLHRAASGQLGMRYIGKYAVAWLKFKLNRRRK